MEKFGVARLSSRRRYYRLACPVRTLFGEPWGVNDAATLTVQISAARDTRTRAVEIRGGRRHEDAVDRDWTLGEQCEALAPEGKMPDGVTGERSTFLSTAPAERGAHWLALIVGLISLLGFIAAVPFARVPRPQVLAFIPICESALAVIALITACLLFAQFSISRSRALLVLACGYLFITVMAVPYTLTFPGLFSPAGWLGASSQSSAWLYMFWHGCFPLFVIAYALIEKRDREAVRPHQASHAIILRYVAAVIGAGCALTLLATTGHDLLPTLLSGDRYTPVMPVISTSVWALSPIALVVLWMRRPHSMLDVWLMVVMCAWLFDVGLSTVLNAGPFDLGFYAGRIFGLLAASLVLLVLLRETWMLYAEIGRLRESEQRERRRDIAERRRLFETSLDLILVVDRKGTVSRVNPRSMPILGYAPEEMMGHSAAEFLDPNDLDNTRAEMRKARRGGIMRNFECRYAHKDGHTVALSWTGLWSEPDQLYFFFGRDMTEQRLGEEKFRLAFESSPSGMIMIDATGTIQMVNAETEKLFGYRRQELIGHSVDLLVPPQFRDDGLQCPTRFIDHTDVRQMGIRRDLFGLRKDGTEFPIEAGLSSIETPNGLIVLSTVIDISERKRVERLKDEFVSTVSHELRTPLTSITASLGLLAGGGVAKLPDKVAHLIGIAHTNSRRLVRLINDILDVEKIEAGKVVFNLERVDMRSLVEQTIEANREFAEGFGVRLRLDPGSGSGASDVTADSDRLTQVVTNLLSNAVKFSPKGEVVVVGLEPRDAAIRLTVRDHGAGIPDDFKPRIFEKFAQADATDARQRNGTGLGLSIVKQIVGRLNGEVGFEDAAGGGTIFHVDLPIWKLPADGEFSRRSGPSHTRLLICEDDPPAANLLAEQLAKAGYTSDIATTGVEAIERATAVRYAAILIDLQLPDCNGISLIQQLRAQPQNRDTQIVVAPADPDRGRGDIRSSILDVLDWIQKPVDIDRLARLLDRPVVRNASRPRILHVDDPDELHVVRRALSAAADWVSVGSIDAARRALATDRFDLVVVDIALAGGSGLDLLPDLRDSEGRAIPVIVLSEPGANPTCAAQVQAALTKSHASIDQLVATLRRPVERKASILLKEKETA